MRIVLKESVSHLLLLLPTKLHFFPRSGSYLLPVSLSLRETNLHIAIGVLEVTM